MIIKDPQARKERANEKRRLFLRFLRDEVFTTIQVAAVVMRCGLRAAQQTVAGMEKAGLVRRHTVRILECLPETSIIGITHHGQAMAFVPEKEVPMERVFEPSKYSMVGLQHRLDLQCIRVSLLENDCVIGWTPGELLETSKGGQRPDALAELASGKYIAVEVERTLKSQKRYRSIAQGHFGSFMAGGWSGVVYVCPDKLTAKRVQAMFLQPWRYHENEMTDQARRFLRRVLFTDYESLTSDFTLKFCDVLEGL